MQEVSLSLAAVKLLEHLLGFNERMIEMIVFGVAAVSAWKVKKAQLLKPKDLANIKHVEVDESNESKENVSITKKNIDIIIEDLKKRHFKLSKHFTVTGLLLVVIFGFTLVILASNFVSSMSTEAAVAEMAISMEAMKYEGGPLWFIIRIVGQIAGIAEPLFPILFPVIFAWLFVFIAGLAIAIITYSTNFRNLKMLLGILAVQASLAAGLFIFNHSSNIIDKNWIFGATIVAVPLSFMLSFMYTGYGITSLFDYCTTCGGKLSKNIEVTVSSKNELAILKLLKNSTVELLRQIEQIDPDEIKEHLKIRVEMCPKDDHSDCGITVSRVQEKKTENIDDSNVSTDLWFNTVFHLSLARQYLKNGAQKTLVHNNRIQFDTKGRYRRHLLLIYGKAKSGFLCN